MATEDAPLTLARVWREMTLDQRTAVAEAFWKDDDSMTQQVEAITHLARTLHFRPQSVLGLPVERKVKQMSQQPRLPDTVIGRALVAYHLAQCRPMLTAFLDELGIAHEDGLIADSVEEVPGPERLEAASVALAAKYPVEGVRLYLRTLAVQDPETWGALGPISAALGAPSA